MSETIMPDNYDIYLCDWCQKRIATDFICEQNAEYWLCWRCTERYYEDIITKKTTILTQHTNHDAGKENRQRPCDTMASEPSRG